MILLASIKARINCPVHKLFNYASNMENYQHWFPGVIDISSANTLSTQQVGKQYTETLEFPSGIEKLIIEVKSVTINQLFMTEGNLAPLLPRMTMKFEEGKEGGSYFTLSYHSRNSDLDDENPMIKSLQLDLKQRLPQAIDGLRQLLT